MSKKQVSFGDDGRHKMLAGMKKLHDAVASTLGPKGRNAIFPKSYGAPQVTNDGVTIAKEIELEDNIENMGAELIKDAASKTNDGHEPRRRAARVSPCLSLSQQRNHV